MVDARFVIDTARALVRIPSVNPALAEDATGESAVADFTQELLEGLGLEVARLEGTPGRPSIVGTLRGGAGPSLMLNAHYDTVGVAGLGDPFGGALRDGRIHGRGAYDMKGALAACLGAVKALATSAAPPPGDVIVAAVADEETTSLGMLEVLEHARPALAVVTEPTQLDVCVAHKGFVWVEVSTEGRPAHGSRPDLGADANLAMIAALARLPAYVGELERRPRHPLLGSPSAHLGRLRGGEGLSTYAGSCTAEIERRTLPGEDGAAVVEELRALVGGGGRLRPLLTREPFEADVHGRLVRRLESVYERVMGRPSRRIGEGPWMDSALLAGAGVDTVVVGPAGGGAHALEEWVDAASLVSLAELLVATARAADTHD
jgi:acetylornithine deacetylase